jgi:cell division protein FtsQ
MVGAVIVGIMVVGFAAWAVIAKSPLFSLRVVRVEGTVRLTDEEVVRASGLRPGINLATVSLSQAARAVRENPLVAHVDVERDLPSTLILRVREREAVAWVRDGKGGALVGFGGTVLERRPRPKRHPVIGSVSDVLSPGDRVEKLGPQLETIAALRPRARREVASGELRRGSVVLRLRSGGLVLIGSPEHLAPKGAALESVLRWSEREGIELARVDIRAPEAPAVRPAGSS